MERYLVLELGSSFRERSKFPPISRYYRPQDVAADFTLSRGERGADSLYSVEELVGTFSSNEVEIPAVFYSLVAHLTVTELEAAYLAPDGGA